MAVTLVVTALSTLAFTSAPQPSAPSYPEIGYRSRTGYCNPYFGFRLNFPAELKPEPMYLPVQAQGRHMLVATYFHHLDRDAQFFISAFPFSAGDAPIQAARERVHLAHEAKLETSGPKATSVHDHQFQHVHISGDRQGIGDESSYFFSLRGWVIHVAVFSHNEDLTATLESVVQHMEFAEPGDSACQDVALNTPHPDPAPSKSAAASPKSTPVSSNSAPAPSDSTPHLYYGPALPTDLVEATIHASPGSKVPDGKLSRGIFFSPEIGVRVELPSGWKPMSNEDAYHLSELMRDPTSDPGLTDRRRALFRACSRVIFTASAPETELIPLVHPMLAVVAMPQGCVPDLVLPSAPEEHAASEEFATILVRSLGTLLLKRGVIHRTPTGRLIFNLDGTLPYQIPNEKLARRLSLRVSVTSSGHWYVFVYSVSSTPAALRDLESHVVLTKSEAIAPN